MRMPWRVNSQGTFCERSSARLTFDAVFLATAVLLSYVEAISGIDSLLMPGLKIGLANVLVTFMFFEMSMTDAGAVSFLRVILTGILFGSALSIIYSAVGAAFAFLGLMLCSLAGERISYIGASVICAALHGVGQLAVAAVFFGPAVALSYLPYLLAGAAVTGGVTGLLLNLIVTKYKSKIRKENKI